MNRAKPYLNKFVLQKQLQITDTYHLQNMKQMKPITSRLMEHTETVIINHSKGQKIKEVREIQISRENQSLLDKMSSVLAKEGSYSHNKMKNFRTKVNKSLNQIYRKKQEENIALENERYLIRLHNKKPTLNLEKIDRDWKNNKKAMKRMSNCQFYLTTFRPKQSSNKSWLGNSIEIKSKLQASKLSKIVVIDGYKMQIKIEFINGFLKIIGEVNNSKNIQIIQIPKKEAMSFLNQDCGGKIENILSKLRYDGKNQVLYIISNCEQESNESEKEVINPEVKFEVQEIKEDQNKPQVEPKASIDNHIINKVTMAEAQGVNTNNKQLASEQYNQQQQVLKAEIHIQQQELNQPLIETPQIQHENNHQPQQIAEQTVQKQIHHEKHIENNVIQQIVQQEVPIKQQFRELIEANNGHIEQIQKV